MPAVALGKRDAARLEVVGSYRQNSAEVTHAAMLAEVRVLGPSTTAKVYQMGRKLEISPPTDMQVDVVAWLPLTDDEELQVDAWLADILTRTVQCTYLAFPAERTHRDPVNGNVTGWTFSCAGFVRSAYLEGIGLDLLGPAASWPEVDVASVRSVWADMLDGMTPETERRVLDLVGLGGPGPWRVLLPGYLVHAVSVGRGSLPYSPTPRDFAFP